ncbi:MAG: NADH-quinone oxidoreductase subunit N [Runella sp.]
MSLHEHLYQVLESVSGIVPETYLAFCFLGLLLLELFFKTSPLQSRLLYAGAWIAILGTGILVFAQTNAPEGYLFHRLLYLDAKAVFFKKIILGATAGVLIHIRLVGRVFAAEMYHLLLAVVLGLCFLTMAVNGLSIYLSLELVSIGSYLMAALGHDKKTSEGGLKYLLFGAMSSAVMLYGLSFVYGIAGTLDLTSTKLVQSFVQNSPEVLSVVGFLVLAGVMFKLSLVPFHVWTPDLYQSTPVPVVSFLSTAPKVAALLVLMRIISALPVDFQRLMAVVVLASILVGNLSALWQNNLKRLMAYSGIAQAGFVVIGLVAFNQTGFENATFYIIVYVLMNVAAFFLIDVLAEEDADLAAFAGRGSQQPLLGVSLTLVMASLVGMPPTAGFTAKLLVFSSLWEAYQQRQDILFLWLLVVGLLNAVVSLFFYFKLPYFLFFRNTSGVSGPLSISFWVKVFAVFLALFLVVLFFKTDILMQLIYRL